MSARGRSPQMDTPMTRTVHIVHGCPSDAVRAMNPETRTYDKHWIPWARNQLSAAGFKVHAPLMPSPWQPDYQAFRRTFEQQPIGERDVLVGHSCGSSFLVRWLGETKAHVAALILVAPWKVPPADEPWRQRFYDFAIDPAIASRVGQVTIFTSSDEEPEGRESARQFHEALRGSLIDLPRHGHYTRDSMGTDEFPELIDAITGPAAY